MLGVKVTANWHDLPAAREPPQGVLPVKPRVNDPALVLVAVTVLGRLEKPSAGLSNNKLAGLNDKGRAEPPVPVPLRLVICGRNPAPLTMNEPLRAPL